MVINPIKSNKRWYSPRVILNLLTRNQSLSDKKDKDATMLQIQGLCKTYDNGESNVTKYGAIPPFKETQAYVKRVAILHQRYASIYRSR